MVAYLIIREGSKWTDVFRLVQGHTVTIGRAPTNQIVIKDDRCSRYHAEIFMSQGDWVIRDLDSRNGSLVNEDPIRGDYTLKAGDVAKIASMQLAFVHDLAAAFPDGTTSSEHIFKSSGDLDELATEGSSEHVLDIAEPTTITHRRGQTKFLKPEIDETIDPSGIPKVGHAATRLCQIAFELANQVDVTAVANLSLEGLFESTMVDAGAVLLLPRAFRGVATEKDLELIASRTDKLPTYHRISRFLANTVLREGEAVLARNVMDDSRFGSRDSKGDIHATSVVCAPIRQNGKTVGIIHLYSSDSNRIPGPDDLEFTLAVADNVALALKNLGRQQELTETLSQSQVEIVELRKRLGAESQIIGSSPLIYAVHEQIARAAPSRATILIAGESGVGKELVARAVHFSSPRKNAPFICINCAALSESLLESELFGHERGAFTGATERKIGKFEAAHEGTLMLDEIGELSAAIQAKFLRVLEGHPFERVGGNEPVQVDVRVIAATNRSLEREVEQERFRRDLYFRLRVVEITVPPLRKRPEDIVELASHFLQKFNSETGRKLLGFTQSALDHMKTYRWPGNVRELKNVIERAVLLTQSERIGIEDLALSNLATSGDTAEISAHISQQYEPLSLAEMERLHISATLEATSWNKSKAAAILGIERSTLDRKIRRYEIPVKTYIRK
ncbi:MAG: sigma-54-dependent Fis family transcriptional regulator [Blastopirellula sp.]|nr:MAG: sigma-54-dependent Fis family transcriptional regulator [Blastopirellula sp.]